jgi:hypothetical protein
MIGVHNGSRRHGHDVGVLSWCADGVCHAKDRPSDERSSPNAKQQDTRVERTLRVLDQRRKKIAWTLFSIK